jgi:hypothetical protein
MLPDITPDKKISSYRRENETKKGKHKVSVTRLKRKIHEQCLQNGCTGKARTKTTSNNAYNDAGTMLARNCRAPVYKCMRTISAAFDMLEQPLYAGRKFSEYENINLST